MSSIDTKSHSDIKSGGWIARLPEDYRPYAYLMRLDRPIGIWLLLFPGLWSIILAAGGGFSLTLYQFYLIFLFIIGAVVMRGAGCVMNDIWDRDLDSKVERTRLRPIASGKISRFRALLFLCVLLAVGFLILIQMNELTIILGLCSLPLIAIYPLMKRITWWPQLFLGVTFNFGALMGWSAVTGALGFSPFLLYIAGVFWTLGYDTIYAYQDLEDDNLAGIKSTARYFQDVGKSYIAAFYALSFAFLAIAIFIQTYSFLPLWPLIFVAAHFAWQIIDLDMESPKSALKIFRSNQFAGFLILLSMVLSLR